jgi:hypothetical protein
MGAFLDWLTERTPAANTQVKRREVWQHSERQMSGFSPVDTGNRAQWLNAIDRACGMLNSLEPSMILIYLLDY